MASSDLQLPVKDAEVLTRLAELPISKTQELFASLQSIEAGVYFRAQVADAVGPFAAAHGFDSEDLARLVRAINQTRLMSDDLNDAEFVETLVAAVVERVGSTPVNRQNLQAAIVNFIALDNVRESIKATLLAFDNERHIHEIKIVSDLRPVFSEGRDEVKSFLIVNSLRIEYADQAEKSKSIFFSLDDDDLAALEKAIVNVRKKKTALIEFVDRSGAKLLEYNE